mmetsp:Transcript_5473/g.7506  ORF Transcript_5473/g.7506 Transcript_5473/m.7506 type:complete len:411 (+) Transcript_5473:94-1326(+)
MNAIFDQGLRLAQDVSYTDTGDATANWFKQKKNDEIKIGKKTDYNVKHNHVEWNFLQHHGEPDGRVNMNKLHEDRGLKQTRFHKGFHRRNVRDIVDHETKIAQEEAREQMKSMHLSKRRERLHQLDKQNEYNLLTGEYNESKFKEPSKKIVDDFRNHPERRNYGTILMRDSHNRFHMQPYSGMNHDIRQQKLVTEGVLKPKMTSVLGIGRNEMPSYGVEDQLSKSNYVPQSKIKIEGHYERFQGGRWTPNKHQMYPEGYWEPTVFPTKEAEPHKVVHETPPPSEHLHRWTMRLPPHPMPFDSSLQSQQREHGSAPLTTNRARVRATAQKVLNSSSGRLTTAPAVPQLNMKSGSGQTRSTNNNNQHHQSSPFRKSQSTHQLSYRGTNTKTPMQRREEAQYQADIDAIRQLH